jgi:hypothetical protein
MSLYVPLVQEEGIGFAPDGLAPGVFKTPAILFGLPGFFRAPGIQNCRGMSLAAKICRRRFAAGRLIQSPWRIP